MVFLLSVDLNIKLIDEIYVSSEKEVTTISPGFIDEFSLRNINNFSYNTSISFFLLKQIFIEIEWSLISKNFFLRVNSLSLKKLFLI
ncbi:hypothetical protein CWU_02975 [Buchnera aphidicola str. JF98 (Acyrthosiphon pisum)]|nr:hypothetical protein CWU_02975 [Buchnera aphidicola str. JF98 (Acyrthosiphon pisum)]